MEERYYTAREAQAKLGLSKAMFFRKVNQGLIPKVVMPGMKQGIYPKRDIDALALSMQMVFTQYEKLVYSRSTPADQLEEMQIGIQHYGRDFITPLPERIAMQQKSEFSFYSLKVEGRVVGYTAMFRLLPAFLDDLLTGRQIERDITVKAIIPFARLESFSIYLEAFAVAPDLPLPTRQFYAETIIARHMDLLLNLLANGYQITDLYTVTTSVETDALVAKLGFRHMAEKSIAPGRQAYVFPLDSGGIDRLRAMSRRQIE